MKNGPYTFLVLVLQMRISSFSLGQRPAFLLEAYNISENSKGSGKTALMRSLARAFLVANVISTLFSCAGSVIIYFQEQFQFCHEVVQAYIQQFSEYSNFAEI